MVPAASRENAMSDTPSEPEITPAEPAEAPHQALRPARPHFIDAPDIVGTAGGEAISGQIADIADGDR
jgi:hypothetical protein